MLVVQVPGVSHISQVDKTKTSQHGKPGLSSEGGADGRPSERHKDRLKRSSRPCPPVEGEAMARGESVLDDEDSR